MNLSTRLRICALLAAASAFHPSFAMAEDIEACLARCGDGAREVARDATTESSRIPPASIQSRILGVNYSGVTPPHIESLQQKDLLGAMKMSGIWVSKLSVERYLASSIRFCKFAAERGQQAYLQLPTTYSNRDTTRVLENLIARGCKPKGFAIGNEVDRLVTDRIVARYALEDYVADYNRIVPLVTKSFPEAKIIALELSSFTAKEYKATDPVAAKYRPIFDWLIPFASASLTKKPDYLSVHFYPFTGGQTEWETLAGGRMLRSILRDLDPHLRGLPPLLIGEFNATYQYADNTAYPGSGGDSFMIALTALDLFATNRVAGVFHWSLWDGPPSTLSLYQTKDLLPAPLIHAYRMLGGVLEHQSLPSKSSKAAIDSYAFLRGGHYRIFLVNTSPFFRRNVTISSKANADVQAEFCDCSEPQVKLTLPPLSMNEVEGNLTGRGGSPKVTRFSYADRVTRSVDPTAPEPSKQVCATLADFSLASFSDPHFENAIFNQNNKIGTGGTFIGVASPGTRATVQKASNSLNAECALPRTGHAYLQCGVKFPLVADALADKKLGTDWTDGFEKGTIRLTVSAEAPVTIEMHLEDFRPEALGYNTHHVEADVSGMRQIDAPIRQFAQIPGRSFYSALKPILRNLAALRIETRQAGFAGRFRIHKVEVCDTP
jgi:hypothetical protein